jgi:hypothetical protein
MWRSPHAATLRQIQPQDEHSMDDSAFLLAQAARVRRLARDIMDAKTEGVLLALAAEYEQRAAAISANGTEPADHA